MLEFNNLTKIPINFLLFKRIAKRILKEERIQDKVEISVVFVSPKDIQNFNKKYRHKDEITDVLSFCLNDQAKHSDKKSKFIFPSDRLLRLGEIIICPQFIKENASETKKDWEESLVKAFIHGILHLLGYDHIEEEDRAIMEERESRYFSRLNKKA